MKPLQCCKEISNEKKKSFSPQPDFIAWFLQVNLRPSCIVTYSVVHWRWWSRFLAYRWKGSAPSFNCHLFVVFYLLLIFLNYEYVFLFSQSRMYGTSIHTLMLRLQEILPRHTSFRLKLPVSTPLTPLTSENDYICKSARRRGLWPIMFPILWKSAKESCTLLF